MRILYLFLINLLISQVCYPQISRFEKSNGTESATYFEAVQWYKDIDNRSPKVLVKEMGMTDAGYPLHLVLVSNDGKFDPAKWHQQNKVVLMINNGIHPGEPDGIDASMMLVRDIINKKLSLPSNVVLGVIPVYNIGGCLNRNSYSRANQNGPVEYGFRGNSENLDLNRDFTKCDSKDAKAFTQIFHWLDPDILLDNHVSDGADYQYTMTVVSSQYDKESGTLGKWFKEKFEPQLYQSMAEKKWEMTPYVDFSNSGPDKGLEMFYDAPRYSSGFAALFQTMGYMVETHMLKPFKDRVWSTYALMQTFIERAAINGNELLAERKKAKQDMMNATSLPMSWSFDSTKSSMVTFKGYEQAFKTSDATGLQRMFYDRNKPYSRQVPYYNVYNPSSFVSVPKAYVVPQGWYQVIELLKLNNVSMKQFSNDTIMDVEAYHIDDYKAAARPFEKHHRNGGLKTSVMKQKIKFLKGDYWVPVAQPSKRYIVEMLEPVGEDSYFTWNFFDAILQQKEGYSDYRWEDLAAEILKNNPELQKKLADKKAADAKFAANSSAILEFIYKNSPYYEPAHLRYPVYRIN